LVFADEAAVLTNMTPRYGRGTPMRAVSGWAYEGGTTVDACEAFAAQSLGPTLKRGDIVIMDRLSSHSNPAVLEVFRELGVEVKLLPAYSPDFNPIEKAWSKVKEAVRRARPRTADELIEAVGADLRAITAEDIEGWFTHCGYHTDS
jgi:transposase